MRFGERSVVVSPQVKGQTAETSSRIERSLFQLGTSAAFDSARAVRIVLYYLFALCLAYTANSLHGNATGHDFDIGRLLVLASATMSVCLWAFRPPERLFTARWALFAILVVLGCLCVCVSSGTDVRNDAKVFVALLAIFPLLVHLLRTLGEFRLLLRAFTDVMTILAIASVALWLFGPITHVLVSNCTLDSSWSTGSLKTINGYFGLSYEVQSYSLPIIGIFSRNTGIYTEAPMFSFALCCALCFEVLMSKRARKPIVAILTLTIVTTVSTTGIVFTILLALCVVLKKTRSQIGKALAAVVIAAGLALAAAFIANKLSTGSGITRLDDFHAAALAWLYSPVFGLGFDSVAYDVVTGHMSAFRSANLGFSNAPTDALSIGGVALVAPMVIALFGFFAQGDRRWDSCATGLLMLYLWTVTVVTFLPLAALVMAMGAERLCSISASGNASRTLSK